MTASAASHKVYQHSRTNSANDTGPAIVATRLGLGVQAGQPFYAVPAGLVVDVRAEHLCVLLGGGRRLRRGAEVVLAGEGGRVRVTRHDEGLRV